MVCGTYFAGSDTILVFKFFHGVFGGGTHLAMTKTILRAGLIVIEAWFSGYCGSPGLGGLPTAGLYPLAGLLDYEDTRLKTLSRVRMGLSLAWKASLVIRICRSPTHCNRLCVTLALSGVYINRGVLVRRTNNNHTIG